MPAYSLNRKDLEKQWGEQVSFIKTSSRMFDEGHEGEAKRLAVTLRVLFHNTSRSKSLLHQLGWSGSFIFESRVTNYSPFNLLSSWPLLSLGADSNGIEYRPLIGSDLPSGFYCMKFDDWWNEIIFDDKQHVFARRDIVRFVADKDGGAHVDETIPEDYAALVKYNSLGWADSSGNPPKNNPAYQAIRTITDEFLVSLQLNDVGLKQRTKHQDMKICMRIDNNTGRRYRWPDIDDKLTEEARNMISGYRKEPRSIYQQLLGDGSIVGLIE